MLEYAIAVFGSDEVFIPKLGVDIEGKGVFSHTYCQRLYLVARAGDFFIQGRKYVGVERLPQQ
jgi:hypothetical protein